MKGRGRIWNELRLTPVAVLLNPMPYWIKYLGIPLLLIFWKRVHSGLYPYLANLFNEVCVKSYIEVFFVSFLFFLSGGGKRSLLLAMLTQS